MCRQYPVTLEHYTKYRELTSELRLQFVETTYQIFSFRSFSELYAYQYTDPSLESLAPRIFEQWIVSMRVFNKKSRRLANFEMICLAKHCLLTQVLRAKPYFIQERANL